MKTVTLYRPVGEKELTLISESGFKEFPPRLEWQPIFYPVLNEQYASEIASKWNTNDTFGNYLGFVTAFEVLESEYLKYNIENVGGKQHDELWVPAENLEAFNAAIVGRIRVTKVYVGDAFKTFENDQLLDELYQQKSIYKTRLDTFLKTKSRKVLPFELFEMDFEEVDLETQIEDQKKQSEYLNDLRKETHTLNTIDDAVDFLIQKALDAKTVEDLKDETPLTQLEYNNNHFGINMYLRNLFFHGNNNQTFLKAVNKYKQFGRFSRGEMGEGYLADALWRRLHQCENSNDETKALIETMEQEKNEAMKGFFETKGLEYGNTTFEELEPIMDELNAFYKARGFDEYDRKIELLSYNFSSDQIDRYIALDKNNEDFNLSIDYEKKAILGGIRLEEQSVYESLKQSFFQMIDVVDVLENKLEAYDN